MNSKLIYNNMCLNRQSLKEQYVPGSGLHKHHIIPRHMGGTDDGYNLTYLSTKEHIIAHYLLWRIYRDPNDLRSMKLLGANLSVEQRRIVGRFCVKNELGFHNKMWDDCRNDWRGRGRHTQIEQGIGIHNPKLSSHYAAIGGKASFESGNNKDFLFWASPEGRRQRASLGGQSHKGKRCMYKPGDKSFKRVVPTDIQSYLDRGYVFGSPHRPSQR